MLSIQNRIKILNVLQPPITSYPVHANTLSTVLIYEESLKWFYDYYIQLFARKDTSTWCYVDFYAPIPWRSCPWIYHQRISKGLVSKRWNSIVEFLIDSIDLDCYAFLYLNQFFIPSSAPHHFNKEDHMHDTYIYGYDLKEKVFYTADFYDSNKKYRTSKLEFTLLEKAYDTVDLSSEDDFIQGILLFSPVDFEGYKVNTNIMTTFINDFLTSSTSSKGHSDGYRFDVETNKDDFCFGMEVFEFLIGYLEEIIQGSPVRDFRCFRILYDHTSMMLMRLEYLGKNGYVKNYMILVEFFRQILQMNFNMEKYAIKAFFVNDTKLFKRLIDMVSEVAKLEKKGLEMILENIL